MSGRTAPVSGAAWSASAVPRCFPSERDWVEWMDARSKSGAHSPCEDCSSAYKRRMLAAGRCERPDAVFVQTEGGEVGISADDPRFARLLMGLKIAGAELLRPLDPTPTFLWLLDRIRRRARPAVRRAIEIYTVRERRRHVGNGE